MENGRPLILCEKHASFKRGTMRINYQGAFPFRQIQKTLETSCGVVLVVVVVIFLWGWGGGGAQKGVKSKLSHTEAFLLALS